MWLKECLYIITSIFSRRISKCLINLILHNRDFPCPTDKWWHGEAILYLDWARSKELFAQLKLKGICLKLYWGIRACAGAKARIREGEMSFLSCPSSPFHRLLSLVEGTLCVLLVQKAKHIWHTSSTTQHLLWSIIHIAFPLGLCNRSSTRQIYWFKLSLDKDIRLYSLV